MAGVEARGQESAGGRRGPASTAATAADATDATKPAASSVTAVVRGRGYEFGRIICMHKKIYESDSMHGAHSCWEFDNLGLKAQFGFKGTVFSNRQR